MEKVFKLKKEFIPELRKPWGRLFKEPKELASFIRSTKPKKLIAVGDYSTHLLASLGIEPDLSIVDRKILRKKVKLKLPKVGGVLKVRNPAGTITREAWNTIKEALSCTVSVRIEVEGEEDLLVMPCVVFSPRGSLILYGLKKQVCAFLVNAQNKKSVRRLLRLSKP